MATDKKQKSKKKKQKKAEKLKWEWEWNKRTNKAIHSTTADYQMTRRQITVKKKYNGVMIRATNNNSRNNDNNVIVISWESINAAMYPH